MVPQGFPESQLPGGFISWAGGVAGTSVLERSLAKATLIEAGEAIEAAVCGTKMSFKMFVFREEPPSAAVTMNITVTRDDSIATPFGLTDRSKSFSPTEKYSVYYKSKKWMFTFDEVAYEIKWGVNSGGNTDVPNASANPFPLGAGMPANSTEFQKKTVAKADLTPDAGGVPPRTRYWAQALTEQHELFHVSDWSNDFYKPKVLEAEKSIEKTVVNVDLAHLVPADVMNSKTNDFHDELINRTTEANSAYSPDKETRAYSDGKAGYQGLAAAIMP
jgi:hypothetical protein